MARHPFDPVSFVFGGLALAAGFVVLAGGSLTDEARVLLPAGLIALGVALLVKVAGRPDEPSPAPAGASTASHRGPDDPFATMPDDVIAGAESDLDRLFAPVDDVLSAWDADRAAATVLAGGDTGIDPVGVAAPDTPLPADDTPTRSGVDDPEPAANGTSDTSGGREPDQADEPGAAGRD